MTNLQVDVSNDAYLARMAVIEAADSIRAAMTAPSVLYRPRLFPDGTMWCALFGENLHEGVAGFGATPHEAMHAFDAAWTSERTPGNTAVQTHK